MKECSKRSVKRKTKIRKMRYSQRLGGSNKESNIYLQHFRREQRQEEEED